MDFHPSTDPCFHFCSLIVQSMNFIGTCICSIVLDAIGCLKWLMCHIFYIQITFFPVGMMLKICIATLDNSTLGMLITRKQHLSQVNMPMFIFCCESLGFLRKCHTKLSYNSFFTSQVLPSWLPGAVLPPAADSGLNKRVYICECWWLWRRWVWQGRGQGAGTREGRRLPLIGRCSPCPSHSLWEEAGCRRRQSKAAGLQRAQGLKLDSALWKTSLGLKSKWKVKAV